MRRADTEVGPYARSGAGYAQPDVLPQLAHL